MSASSAVQPSVITEIGRLQRKPAKRAATAATEMWVEGPIWAIREGIAWQLASGAAQPPAAALSPPFSFVLVQRTPVAQLDEWYNLLRRMVATCQKIVSSVILYITIRQSLGALVLVVTVKFVVADGKIEGFLPLMQENAAASVAQEQGCQRFDVCQHPDDPNEIFLYEIYDDAAAFGAHKTMPHYIDFTEASDQMVTSKTVHTYWLLE